MRMATEAQIKAQKKYDAENTRQVNLKLNRRTDGDVLEKLDSVPNKQGYIKELIRADLKK
ncbi:MAG: Transcriptional regulator, RHH-like, CopG [Bacteriophage sp.]|nr:MAG: Transcriptional regulator, RHH-like, CopG [Bacteriophage sp.]